MARDAEMLRALFARVHAWATRKSLLTPRLTLRVGSREVVARRRAGDARAFFHTHGAKVCTVPEAARLPLNYLTALMLHEIGHPLAQRIFSSTEQWDADRAVRQVYGIALRYRGPLLLEWVPDAVVRRVLRGAPPARSAR